MQEVWKPVHEFEGAYEVSNLGRIRSLDRYVNYVNNGTPTQMQIHGKILKLYKDEDGYLRINMKVGPKSKTFGVHRLVAQAFIPNPNNLPCVNHLDYNRQNNCVDNLEWCTVEYNNKYSNNEIRRPHSIYENRSAVKQSLSHSVKCIETGQIFSSMIDAERKLRLWGGSVCTSVKTGCKIHGKYTFVKLTGDKRTKLPNGV